MMVYLVMGVSGSGKSTIGKLLGQKLSLPFYDADDFHPESNIQKMASGQALNDEDRAPWLENLAREIGRWRDSGGAVLACSALKEKYRKALGANDPDGITWVYLDASFDLIRDRLEKRKDHFFPIQLLTTQFEALEIPAYGLHIDMNQSPDGIVDDIINGI